jgi:hypothetical protein
MNVRRNARIAEGSNQNRIEIAPQHLEAVGRNGHAVAQVTISAPVELTEFNLGACSPDDFDGLGNNFLANAIPRDDRDALAGR